MAEIPSNGLLNTLSGVSTVNGLTGKASDTELVRNLKFGPVGVFWRGADGQVYVKGDGGTNAAGAYDANTSGYWGSRGFQEIADPAQRVQQPQQSSAGGYSQSAYDPMRAARDSFNQSLDTKIGGLTSGAGAGFDASKIDLQRQADKMLFDTQAQQKGIDTARENNSLNFLNNLSDIRDFVRRGVQGANTMLSNSGAMNSSAAGELGRIYSELGQSKTMKAGNEQALKERDIASQEDQLRAGQAFSLKDLGNQRDSIIANIGTDIQQKLQALDAESRGLGITGRVQIDALKNQVVNEGRQKLMEVNNWLQSQFGNIKSAGTDQVNKRANELQMAGQTAGDLLGLGESSGIQAGAGMGLNQLPIFLQPRKDDKNR